MVQKGLNNIFVLTVSNYRLSLLGIWKQNIKTKMQLSSLEHSRKKTLTGMSNRKNRKYGNFLHNTDPSLNTGVLITCRRPQAKHNYTNKGFCCLQPLVTQNTQKVNVAKSKLEDDYGFCHPRQMKQCSAYSSKPQDDEVGSLIKYDELIILFGNKQCNKYTQRHQHDMIRNRLRLLARFLLAAQQIRNTITDLLVYITQILQGCCEAVRICGNYDPIEGMFKTPFNALSLGSLLKNVLL
nr:unnamed protein product [Callosobruchus analis]